MEIDLSIIIVNFNTCELLKNCLHSIYENTKHMHYEVFVVDNASQDNSIEMIKKEFENVKLIANHQNIGFTAANNLVVVKAKGAYLLFLNPDTIVKDNALEELFYFMKQNPDVGICGPRLLNEDGSFQLSYFKKTSLFTIFSQLFHLPKLFPSFFDQYQYNQEELNPIEVGWVSGACMMTKKSVLDDVGSFDENMFMYGEDAELCLRISRSGYKIMYIPTQELVHLGNRSSRENRKRAVLSGYNSHIYFFGKHKGRISKEVVKSFLILSSLTKIFIWFFSKDDKERKAKIEAHWYATRKILMGQENN